MPFTSKDDDPRKSKLQVRRRLEVDLLRVHPGRIRIAVSLQVAEQPLIPEWPKQFRQQRDIKRLDAIDAQCINRLCVGAPCHRAAFARAPPVLAFADGNFVIQHVQREIRVDQPEFICGVDRCGWQYGDLVHGRDRLANAQRICAASGRVLKLAANLQRQADIFGARAEPSQSVEAAFIGATEVVDER
jgi:hypothetical protein